MTVPGPGISNEQALVIGKQLAKLNSRHWDDATACAKLSNQFFGKLCWEVMPGFEEKEWVDQETDDYPTTILLDAETGAFAGLRYMRGAVPAEQLLGKYFKVAINK